MIATRCPNGSLLVPQHEGVGFGNSTLNFSPPQGRFKCRELVLGNSVVWSTDGTKHHLPSDHQRAASLEDPATGARSQRPGPTLRTLSWNRSDGPGASGFLSLSFISYVSLSVSLHIWLLEEKNSRLRSRTEPTSSAGRGVLQLRVFHARTVASAPTALTARARMRKCVLRFEVLPTRLEDVHLVKVTACGCRPPVAGWCSLAGGWLWLGRCRRAEPSRVKAGCECPGEPPRSGTISLSCLRGLFIFIFYLRGPRPHCGTT